MSKIKILLLFFAGAANVLAFSPFYIFFLPCFSVSYLLFNLYHTKNIKESFIYGWVYGFGFLFLGLYWISNALLTGGVELKFLIPLSATLIPTILAVYYGVCCAMTYFLRNYNKIIFSIIFAALWTICEIFRTYLFSGFPWLIFGYISGVSDIVSQSVSVISVFGLSFFIILASSFLFVFYNSNKNTCVYFSTAIIVVLISSILFGNYKLQHVTTRSVKNIKVVQPNIPINYNWSTSGKAAYLKEMINLSRTPSSHNIKYVVWPEIPIPLNLFQPTLARHISDSLPPNTKIIANSIRIDYSRKKVYNSSVILKNGKIIDYYDKSHLVPFGEYIPFRSWLPLKKLSAVTMDFSPGSGVKVIDDGDKKIALLICYESFFPREVITNTQPDFFVNLTNDSWYNNSIGPYLHLEMTKFRSIERNTPMLRAANSGISAIINSHGGLEAFVPIGIKGSLLKK